MADTTRRSYGSGRLYTRTDRNGLKTWYGSFYVNGRRINRRLGPKRAPGSTEGLTQSQAEKELRREIGSAVPSVRLGGDRMTVEEVSARYIAHVERRGRKPSTRENIESETRVHLAPFFRRKTLDAISYEDVLDLLAVLEDKRLSPKSIWNIIATLSALFTFARAPQRRWAASNPCEGIELPAVAERTEIRFLSLDEVRALVANVRHGMYEQLDRSMFLAAAMTGLRKG